MFTRSYVVVLLLPRSKLNLTPFCEVGNWRGQLVMQRIVLFSICLPEWHLKEFVP